MHLICANYITLMAEGVKVLSNYLVERRVLKSGLLYNIKTNKQIKIMSASRKEFEVKLSEEK